MTLTAGQIKARAGKLTGSRIGCLMTGDREAIHRLYLEMIGEAEPENIDHIWAVQLGSATEQLNLNWYEMTSGNNPVIRRGEVVQHPEYPWAAATLDGFDAILKCPVEAKHCGGREPLEVIMDRYAAQTQWLMEVTQTTQCALSVIFGANAPIVEYVDRDGPYAAEMVRRGAQFMRFVEMRMPPVILDPVPPPADACRIYDFSANAEWKRSAEQWLQVCGAAQTAKECEIILKKLVPEDAKKAFGCGIRITRDRAGRLSLRQTEAIE